MAKQKTTETDNKVFFLRLGDIVNIFAIFALFTSGYVVTAITLVIVTILFYAANHLSTEDIWPNESNTMAFFSRAMPLYRIIGKLVQADLTKGISHKLLKNKLKEAEKEIYKMIAYDLGFFLSVTIYFFAFGHCIFAFLTAIYTVFFIGRQIIQDDYTGKERDILISQSFFHVIKKEEEKKKKTEETDEEATSKKPVVLIYSSADYEEIFGSGLIKFWYEKFKGFFEKSRTFFDE